ncbi:MAG: hypothetical protein CFH34_01278 [Alphaproteobacteria bacterium MarineAlpha9_Bin4]|nr:hypothetical protein [Pelagibacterales bacterium]PPR25786.1 MAG: hypothetical protein CFH34_01278 [Alphaproteobacteria bacterium MarineAlpha9_Bin4]|tara:strand:- start:653 stop:1078 length:426 start_codon:yes stop_codon:yes gene_type:complete
MILYDLNCENNHVFEAWFASSSQYEEQKKKKLINCPICNSNKIKKALMAPKLKGTKKTDTENSEKTLNNKKFIKELKKFKNYVENNTIDVGKNFTEEAKKIYYGETESKPIRGETTKEQAEELLDEGIPIARLPWSSREDA